MRGVRRHDEAERAGRGRRGRSKIVGDGTGRLLIRRSKTDQAERDTPPTCRARPCAPGGLAPESRITDGSVFRRIIGRGAVTYNQHGKGRIGGRLSPEAVALAFKAVAKFLKMSPDKVEASKWPLGAGGGDTGLVGAKHRPGVGNARRAVDDRAYAHAVR